MDTTSPLWRAYVEGTRGLAATPRAAPRPTPRQITAAAKAFVASLAWRLEIPGQHYSGLSNQALLDVRANEGRDYGADTVQLRQYLRRELAERFAAYDHVPTLAELQALTSKLIVNYVANERVLGEGGDVIVPPLTARYAAWKRAQGKGGKPVGVFRGRWLAALRKARVVFG